MMSQMSTKLQHRVMATLVNLSSGKRSTLADEVTIKQLMEALLISQWQVQTRPLLHGATLTTLKPLWTIVFAYLPILSSMRLNSSQAE